MGDFESAGIEDDGDLARLEEAETKDALVVRETSGPVHGRLYRVKIKHSSETLLAVEDKDLEMDGVKDVIIATKYGNDVGEILGQVINRSSREEIVKIVRLANEEDLHKRKVNQEKEKEAYLACLEKINSRNLPMKLVSVHYMLDEPKILFFFTSESRVDFRELVKDLVAVFRTRIELRQIGVRDEARVLGGIGVCGQVFCCHKITDKMSTVSIKMAKDQNLSLNSMKISGPCGRLLCCLSYEYQFYKESRRSLPSEGVKLMHDGILYKVNEVNAPKGMVRLVGEDGRVVKVSTRAFSRNSEGRWVISDQVDSADEER